MSNHCELQVRSLYGKRTEMQIELALMLIVVAWVDVKRGKIEDAIKCFEESISLVDEDCEWVMDIQTALLNLAICYAKIGQKAKTIDLIQRAYKTEMCVDIEHFKTRNPGAEK